MNGLGSFLRAAAALALVAAHIAAAPAAASAQGSTALDLVERLMQENRYGEARGVLLDWWEEPREGLSRTDLQRGLWLRAILTVDPTLAEQDFRRLVIEFPGGPWSDEALMRLARTAEAMGDLRAAREHLQTLVRDYAGSPLRSEARLMQERLEREGGPGLL